MMIQWLTDVGAWLGLPLTVVGFALAIWQIVKTRTAAKAAETAANRATAAMSESFLLVLLPQLHKVESDLDSAVDRGERHLAANHMSQWRWQAGQLRGLLEPSDPASKKIAKSIQTSITLAASAKIDALDPQLPLSDVSRPVQDAIAAVTGEVGQLSMKQPRGKS
jgi:hypothetical protein